MAQTKIIAFYLPQYHCFKENDEWWGKGFTEWTNTKKAKPIFKNHYQPKTPLNENYYNLLNEETREWQYKIAEEHGIYGFCYYHYWFDGRLLMEKPVELMLNDKTDFPFCLCWANEPWTRTWDGGNKDVIMPQKYAGETDWENHFNYLLPFFKSERYIKIDNKPVFVLYRSNNIPDCDEMITYWDNKCKEQGFSGIYLVEELNTFQQVPHAQKADAVLNFEPMRSLGKRSYLHKVVDKFISSIFNMRYKCNHNWKNYKSVAKITIKHKKLSKKQFYGFFVNFDNTARKKKNAMIIYNNSVETFKKYLRKQLQLSQKDQSEFLFINAWNEWAEGAYLEPDEKNGYAYLQAVKEVVSEQQP